MKEGKSESERQKQIPLYASRRVRSEANAKEKGAGLLRSE
jgi:hypothetical protein